MDTKRTIRIAILLMIMLLSFISLGCNTENQGVFKRISESVIQVDVGSVDLIMKNGNKLYANTGKSGLQSFDTVTGDWASIPRSEDEAVYHYTSDGTVSTDGTAFIYATGGTGSATNDLYAYDPVTASSVDHTVDYQVIAMVPQHNLILRRTGTGGYAVTTIAGTDHVTFATEFSETIPPSIIASNPTDFIVTGKSADNSKFLHFFGSSKDALDPTDADFDDTALVAMGIDGTEIVVIDANGKTWQGETTDFVFDAGVSISGWPASRYPSDAPYPVFTEGTLLYLQDGNNDFQEITIADGIAASVSKTAKPFAAKLANIAIKSYVRRGTDVYVGTMQNGIFWIDLSDFSSDSF